MESRKYQYMTSLLTFYMKGEIEVSEKSVKLTVPNTIGEFIPLGKRTYEPLVSQIASVNSSFHLNGKSLLVGFILTLLGISLAGASGSELIGIIFLIIGVCQMVSSFETILYVTDSSGMIIGVDAVIFDKATIEKAGQDIHNMLMLRSDDTNTRKQTDRVIDAINNK